MRRAGAYPGSGAVMLLLALGLAGSVLGVIARRVAVPELYTAHPVVVRPLPDMRIDLNRAPAGEISAVPGIGPRLAQRIVLYREAYGPFARVDDVTAVPGIGPRLLESLHEYAVVKEAELP